MASWLPSSRRGRAAASDPAEPERLALTTPVPVRPAPVTPTPGGAGSAVRAAMERVRAAAAAVVEHETADGEADDRVEALDEAVAALDQEVARLVAASVQQADRARREAIGYAAISESGVWQLRRGRRGAASGGSGNPHAR